MDNTTIETFTQGAHDSAAGRSYRRELRHATKQGEAGHARIELTINAADDFETYYVRWTSNRGRAWGKSYRRSGFASEAAARAFADTKWATCLAWLAEVTPVAGRPIDAVHG